MKKYICIIIVLTLLFCVSARALPDTVTTDIVTGTETETESETTEEITEEEPPTEADDSEDTARIFMNINIYMFAGALILLLICTVVFFVLKARKKRANTEKIN